MAATGDRTAAAPLLAPADDTPVTTPRTPAREAAERELSKPVYEQHEPSLFQRLLDGFWEWLDGLFSTAAGASPGGAAGLVAIVIVVLLLAAALRLRLGVLRRSTSAPDTALFPGRPLSATEHRAAAERHAAEGDWNRAVQERMRAIVRSLEERALLDPRPGRTADEAADEAARALPGHADRLHAAAHDFDAVAYGGHQATASTYDRLHALDRDLRRSRPRLTSASGGGDG